MADTPVIKQIADKVKDVSNILVTVNSSPSVDELSAALGITLLLNKLDKHATAVFSGEVPSAMEFLSPEKTFEGTVDSLRDFIIALDKEKADHLRYKVVDDMVKIFITPYRTTISEQDLDFSQGDYNVEAVLAIGVQKESDLDHALSSHGRILHDATVAAISLGEPTSLGGIEWADGNASSYSEMLYRLAEELKATDKKNLDEQVATAFLTGIVAATNRFSNNKTNSSVMTIAAQLMAAGANQQLIATKLQDEAAISSSRAEGEPAKEAAAPAASAEGGLSIDHEATPEPEAAPAPLPEVAPAPPASEALVAPEAPVDRSTEAHLTRQADAVAQSKQIDATEAAEQQLAEQLAATAPPAQDVLRGAVSMDQWKAQPAEPPTEPSIGGTLNATTEQAAEDKRREIADDRNKVILSHGGPYVSDAPSMQAPFNAANDTVQEEGVRDIFAENPNAQSAPTSHVDMIQPPAPSGPAPTLADLEAQAKASQQDAMSAVDTAFANPSAPAPAAMPAPEAPTPPAPGLPALPPLPPMPDFSTLPPLPSAAPVPPFGEPVAAGMPAPAPMEPLPPQPSDPAQFQIPGQ